jgi:hypothetical protein
MAPRIHGQASKKSDEVREFEAGQLGIQQLGRGFGERTI